MLNLIRCSFLSVLLGSTATFAMSSGMHSLPMAQVTRQAGVYVSPDGQCEATLKVSEWGDMTLSVIKKNDKNSINAIKDITGVVWLGENQLFYSVSPIYGKPGIFSFDCTSMLIKQVLRPRTINKAYPDGADYFELQDAVPGAKGIIYFYYASDVDTIDFKQFRTEGFLYQVSLDGTGFGPCKAR